MFFHYNFQFRSVSHRTLLALFFWKSGIILNVLYIRLIHKSHDSRPPPIFWNIQYYFLHQSGNHPSLPDHPDHALYQKYFPNGGASIFTFNIKGGREEAFTFIDNLKIFSLLANVADVKSLVIHPASTTHSQLTDAELAEQQIYQNTIRLSIGTEHIDDILADLEAGFAAVRGK